MRTIRIAFLLVAMAAMAIPVLAQNAGWIGISIDDQKDRGAVVRRVERDSPAEKAGLKEGDTILEFNKEQVIGAQQLTRLVRTAGREPLERDTLYNIVNTFEPATA